jgi:Competence-damaged protein
MTMPPYKSDKERLLPISAVIPIAIACILSSGRGCGRVGAGWCLAQGAGPGGGTVEKPVGTVWLALASSCNDKIVVWKDSFPTDRITLKQIVIQSTLDRLRKNLKNFAL